MTRLLILGSVLTLLVGCGSTGSSSSPPHNPNEGRYSLKHDRGPSKGVNLDHVKDAVPRAEPRSRGGNRSPYRVLGKTYYVMPSADGYRERGVASWYGKKFHGHKTSNGEVYDMYAMSAAHKALPLPTFLRVTNLDNGRQVIVRVNDRGPFHGNRLIDLSYAAAYKLDMLKKGTARVELEAITPSNTPVTTSTSGGSSASTAVGRYFQLGAYASRQAAENVQREARNVLPGLKVRVQPATVNGRQLYRVQAGPLSTRHPVGSDLERLRQAGYGDVRVVDLN